MTINDVDFDKLRERVLKETPKDVLDIVSKYFDKPLTIEAYTSMSDELDKAYDIAYADVDDDELQDEDLEIDELWMVYVNLLAMKAYEENNAINVVVMDLNGLEDNNRDWFPDTRFDLPWALTYDRHETNHLDANLKIYEASIND